MIMHSILLKSHAGNKISKCSYFCLVSYWSGWNDNKDEGIFANHLTGKILKEDGGFWPWGPGEPNGGVLENCAAVFPLRNNTWMDVRCEGNTWVYGFCEIQPRPRLIIRGIFYIVYNMFLYYNMF